jgi:hypothetical protein
LHRPPDGLGRVPATWPELRVVLVARDPADEGSPPGILEVEECHARVRIVHGDLLEIDREPLTVTMHVAERLSGEALIHPYLALPAAIGSRWMGRQVIHAGAFLRDGRAWALTAGRGGGKSSTLGELLARGTPILTDDLAMIDGGTMFSGPRSIDLRKEAANLLGGDPLGFLGSRERWRLRPPPTPMSAPLAGFVTLEWGEALRMEPLDARERLEHIAEHSFMGPARADQLATLTLAALPAWRLIRPRLLDSLPAAVDELLGSLP